MLSSHMLKINSCFTTQQTINLIYLGIAAVSGLQSLPSPVPELSFLSALYRGLNWVSERRVQDNLHAYAQSESIKNY